MARFEKVSKYRDVDINLPVRKTKFSAGYDFEVAEDTVVPSLFDTLRTDLLFNHAFSAREQIKEPIALAEITNLIKQTDNKLTLVPTGVKCYLANNQYLELSVRSSTPLKSWLILANGVGIIDADYADNPDNEGHIYFQLINLGPYDILLKKGDIIGQGIIHTYDITEDDIAIQERTGGFGSTT